MESAVGVMVSTVPIPGAGPNVRGTAMAAICSFYLQQKGAVLYT